MKQPILTRSLSLLMALLMVLALPAGTLLEVRAADLETESTQPVEDTEEPEAEEPKSEEPEVEETKTEEPKVEETKTEEPKVEETKTEEPKAEETKVEETKTEESKAEEKTVYVEDGHYLAPEELNVYITARMDEQSDNAAPEAKDLEEKYTGVAVFYDYNETDENKRLEHPYYFYYKEGKLQDQDPVFTSAKGYLELLSAPVAEKTVNTEVSADQAERPVYVAREVYLERDAKEHADYLFAFNRESEDNGLFTGVYQEKTYAEGLVKEESGKKTLAPAVQLQLSANTSLDGVALEWGAVSGAAGYRVFRSTEGAKPQAVKDLAANATAYTDRDVASGKSYTYSVRAYLGNAGAMAKDQDYTDTEKWSAEAKADSVYYLTAPKVTLKSGSHEAVLTWNAVNGADGYILKRSENGNRWVDFPVTKQRSYTDKQLKNGNRYFYTVQAVNSAKHATSAFYDKRDENREYAAFYSIPQLTFRAEEKGVMLTWTADQTATGYRIFRWNATSRKWVTIANIANGKTLSYLDSDVKNGNSYRYTVRAYYGDANKLSTTGGYDTLIWSEYQPALFRYLCIKSAYSTKDGLYIKWDAVPGVTGYQLSYRTSPTGTWSRTINPGTNTSYLFKNVKNGQKYYLAFRTYVKDKNGKNIYATWTKLAQPYVFHSKLNVKPQLNDSGCYITWNLDQNATGYRVFRKEKNHSDVIIKNIPASELKNARNGAYLDSNENLTNGKTYYYTVRAYYGSDTIERASTGRPDQWGSYEWQKITFLATPKLTRAWNFFDNSCKVTWEANKAAGGYRIYRKVGTGDDWHLIGKVNKGTTNYFLDTNVSKVASGTVLTYTVRAYDVDRDTLSGYDRNGVEMYYLAEPANIKVALPKSSGTQITWSAVRGSSAYYIYRRVGTSGNWTLLGNVQGTTYVDKEATQQLPTPYRYIVRSSANYNNEFVISGFEKLGYTYGIVWRGSERNEWVKKGGETFYVDREGFCVTGWQYLRRNGRKYKYYFDTKTGALVTNLYSYFGRSYRDMDTRIEVYLDSNDNYAGHVTFLIYDDTTRSYCIPAVCFRCIGNMKYTRAWNGIGTSYMRAGAGKNEFVQLVEGGAYERYATRVSGSDSFFHSVLYNRPDSYSLKAKTYNSLIDNRNNSTACIRCQAIYAYLIHDLMKNGYGNNNNVTVNIYRNERDSGPFGIPQVEYISRSQDYDPTDPAVTGKFFYATQIREGNHWISATAGAAPWEWY